MGFPVLKANFTTASATSGDGGLDIRTIGNTYEHFIVGVLFVTKH